MSTNIAARSGTKIRLHAPRYREDSVTWQNSMPGMAETGEIDLRGFARMLNRHKGLLLLCMAIAMVATVIWLTQVTPEYAADVLIAIEPRPSSIVKVDESLQDTGADPAMINTEIGVLESRSLADRVMQNLHLYSDPEFAPKEQGAEMVSALEASAAWAALLRMWDSIELAGEKALAFVQLTALGDQYRPGDTEDQIQSTAPQVETEAGVASQPPTTVTLAQRIETDLAAKRAALLNQFLRHLTVTPIDNSRLIRISFWSTDPVKAASIADQIVHDYVESQLEKKSAGAKHAAEWLEVRLSELGESVNALEREVQHRRAESGSNAISIVAKTLEQLNSELVSAQAATAEVKSRYEQAEGILKHGGNLEALPSVIGSKNMQEMRSRYSELSGRLSDLQTTYGDHYPTVVATRAEMADLARRQQLEIENVLAGLRNEVKAAEIREAKLRRELKSVSAEMVRLNGAETSIEQVAQRLRAGQELYQNLLKRHTEAVALRENQQPDARIVSAAQIPLRPSFPSVPKVLLLAFIGSASLSTLLVVVVERLRQRLDSIDDAERHIGLPIVGTIPDLPRLRRMRTSPSDYIQREPLSEFGGAFQRLRALLIVGNDRRLPSRLLVTSAIAGEGKTTTAVCLGFACVAAGQRVLLVDCDFGRPRLHSMLGVANEKGLTDVVKGAATLDEAIVHAAGISLSVLTIGRSHEGAIDLLNYGRMEDLLAKITDGYDTVILDSAPVLEVSNALMLGDLAEKTVLVARRNWTSGRKVSEAARQLELYGANVAGLVFNRADGVDSY